MKIKHPSDTDKKHIVIFRAGIINRRYFTGPTVAILTGVNFNNLTAGAGIGINGSGNNKFHELVIALKAYPLPGKISPIIYTEMGYASGRSYYREGSGPIINFGTGLKIRYKRILYCYFEIGFKIFMIKYSNDYYKEYSNDNYFGGTISIGV
ncbi:MAG: hypothetical protein JSW64_05365 [Candidatus Zixiibacteriota bacterium]|nr:MAG: hypothetical protein JSW64_05365 [candidate division Zixibacteria bacterium]